MGWCGPGGQMVSLTGCKMFAEQTKNPAHVPWFCCLHEVWLRCVLLKSAFRRLLPCRGEAQVAYYLNLNGILFSAAPNSEGVFSTLPMLETQLHNLWWEFISVFEDWHGGLNTKLDGRLDSSFPLLCLPQFVCDLVGQDTLLGTVRHPWHLLVMHS